MITDPMIEETVEGLLSSRYLPVVMYRCSGDQRWHCLSVSESLEARFGIAPTTWTSDPHVWLQHVHPDDRERLVLDRIAAMEERRKLSTEYRLRTGDGRYRWVHDEAELVLGDDEMPSDVYGVITDITHRRYSDMILSELYEAARGQVTRLETEVSERDLFARLLAHDLRMPLAAAIRALDDADAAVAGSMTRARGAIDQAYRLVNAVLEVDRWADGRPLQMETARLRDVAELAVETIGFGSHELVIDVPDRRIELDVLLVSRALANLVDNAVKHSPTGGTIRLRAHEQAAPRSVIFSVEDDGQAPASSLGDDPFRPVLSGRVDHSDPHGLGLTLVQRLAQLHGGRVWYEELPAGGLAFHLLVSLSPAMDVDRVSRRSDARPGDAPRP